MKKIMVGPQIPLYPITTFLAGAKIGGKANFMTAAGVGIACLSPPMITLAIQHRRHTLKGIKETGVFSLNIPGVDQARETDFCGMVSGTKEDKAAVCGFTVFYGKLEKAPLIAECPVNLECKVVHLLNLGSHALVVGEIEEVHVSERWTTSGEQDSQKLKPLLYITGPNKSYFHLGDVVGPALKIGLDVRKAE